MKLLILVVVAVALVEAGSPEQWAEETFKFIQNYKGDKKGFNAALTLQMVKDAPKMKTIPKEDKMKGIELLCSKLTGSEVVTADELKAFFDNMMKTMPGGR